MSQFKVAGIGEVLWDVFPDGEKFGGAPGNFSCHCRSLGAHAYVISCVGNDARGEMAADFLSNQGVDVSALAVSDDHETGVVLVTLDSDGRPSYEIKEDVAWDHLPNAGELNSIARSLDAVCFGSLAQRNPASCETIRKFLTATPSQCLRVFDVNLRQPFCSEGVVRESLTMANVLKLNDDELRFVASMYHLEGPDEVIVQALLDVCGLKLVALTRGSRESLMAAPGAISDIPGLKITVADTVGAGDAFTAAMIIGFMDHWSLHEINEHAGRVAAFVCSQAGAVPDLPEALRSHTASGMISGFPHLSDNA